MCPDTDPNQVDSIPAPPQRRYMNAASFEKIQSVHVIANSDGSQGKSDAGEYRLTPFLGHLQQRVFETFDILRVAIYQRPNCKRGTATRRIEAMEIWIPVVVVLSIARFLFP